MPERIPIYCVPGLAASSNIFEYIKLPPETYEVIYLEWLDPESKDEALEHYASRMAKEIKHPCPVLIGVSFGGVVVQEMSKVIETKKLIIISSVKSVKEMPGRLIWLRKTGLFRLLPVKKISKIDDFSKYSFHQVVKRKAELYNKYMRVRNEIYLNWAIKCILNWKGMNPCANVLHIHGTRDEIFPIKHIDNCVSVEGGTHAMIITRAKKISEIILNNLES